MFERGAGGWSAQVTVVRVQECFRRVGAATGCSDGAGVRRASVAPPPSMTSLYMPILMLWMIWKMAATNTKEALAAGHMTQN